MPEVSLPWGFDGWSPQTTLTSGGWWFYSEAHSFYGIRCTKQPSPWINDYGNFRVMGHLIDAAHQGWDEFASYDPSKADWSPYHFAATLLPYGVTTGSSQVEVTPTMHGALIRFTFPAYSENALDMAFNQTRRILVTGDYKDGNGADTVQVNKPAGAGDFWSISGVSRQESGGEPTNYGHYYYMTFSSGSSGAGAPVAPFASAVATNGNNEPWAYLDFDQLDPATACLVIRVATSLISPAQAVANHAAEVAGVDFDDAVLAAKSAWHVEASRVAVTDVGCGYTDEEAVDLLTIFYSSLFRAAKYPRQMWETDKDTGATVHWSPYTGVVEQGLFSSDQGFWVSGPDGLLRVTPYRAAGGLNPFPH
jgi:putative alpha-1,2-mannosidase